MWNTHGTVAHWMTIIKVLTQTCVALGWRWILHIKKYRHVSKGHLSKWTKLASIERSPCPMKRYWFAIHTASIICTKMPTRIECSFGTTRLLWCWETMQINNKQKKKRKTNKIKVHKSFITTINKGYCKAMLLGLWYGVLDSTLIRVSN